LLTLKKLRTVDGELFRWSGRVEFSGKKVVVTGAAGIFGRWITEAFLREGAHVCLSDMRADASREIVASANARAQTIVHATELTDAGSIDDLCMTVERHWGAPDIVINNAGVYPKGLLLDIPVEEWDRIFDVNLRAPFLIARGMARLMIKGDVQGSMIFVSSGAARQMRNTVAPYCTSKTALERLAKGFALELAPHKIRVNVVEPGFAPGSVVSPLSEEHITNMKKRIPLARTSDADDVPSAIFFLSSAKASFITGAVLAVDGGNSIGTFEPGHLLPNG
jgi:3-oxoacyl-[acyl-carrier protein] reductase